MLSLLAVISGVADGHYPTGDIAVTALGGVFLAYVATVIVLEWLTRDNNAPNDSQGMA